MILCGPPSMERNRQAVRMLLDGHSSDDVIRFVKQRITTLKSLNTTMSLIRTMLMHEENRSPECDLTELRQHAEAADFLNAPLAEQYKIARAHKSYPSWSAVAEEALQRVTLLPSGVDDFFLSRADIVELKRSQAAAQKAKNDSVVVIKEPERVIERLEETLRNASSEHDVAHLALALLLCSGRRTVEILNGRSTFEAVDSEYHCLFRGQAKKRDKGTAYVIPLLCPFPAFQHCLGVLRKTQPADIATRSNVDVHNMYQGKLRRHIAKGGLAGMPEVTVHDHRAAYCSFVYSLFVSSKTFASTICDVLGHESLDESLCYSHVRLMGDLRKLGPLMPRTDECVQALMLMAQS